MLRKISPTDNILTPWSARGKPKCSGVYEFLESMIDRRNGKELLLKRQLMNISKMLISIRFHKE